MNMINNLFSIFDPSTSYSSIVWLTVLVPIIITIKSVNSANSNNMITIYNIVLSVNKEVEQLMTNTQLNATNGTIICLFASVIAYNIIAILPFNFTTTAHISITFSISMTLWLTTVINATNNSTNSTLIHLTPIGTPAALINFIVLIETISQIIRPITLAVRLIANIVAGHLLLNLLSNFSLISPSQTFSGVVLMVTLLTLETAVALIQAYVITILITLYFKETL